MREREPLLDQRALDEAVAYNRARPYTSALWSSIQRVICAQIDGIPGSETADRLAAFQEQRGLDADGKAGRSTLAALDVGPIFSDDPGAFYFRGRMQVDADGAPNAYHPQDIGIDYLSNGKASIVCDAQDEPYIQRDDDPCPGHYVSATALFDPAFEKRDPRRYVDATAIPYIVLPGKLHDLTALPRARKGDLAAVVRATRRDQVVYAIYADVGPALTRWDADRQQWLRRYGPDEPFGEGSVKLAEQLDHDPYRMKRNIRRVSVGISAREILYIVFPGSGDGRPLPADEIARRGEQAFQAWGGHTALDRALRRTS